MDPIETWHDAPTFEALEAKIKTLEAKLARMVDAAEGVYESGEFYGNTFECEGGAVMKLKSTIDELEE